MAELTGQSINLVELSVSHYLLARALEQAGLAEKDVTVVNTSDADIVSVFAGTEDVQNVVTWNPLLSEVAAFPGAAKLFDSSQIPGEIIDLMVVNTATLDANPAFGKALVGGTRRWRSCVPATAGSPPAPPWPRPRHRPRRLRRPARLHAHVLGREGGGRFT